MKRMIFINSLAKRIKSRYNAPNKFVVRESDEESE